MASGAKPGTIGGRHVSQYLLALVLLAVAFYGYWNRQGLQNAPRPAEHEPREAAPGTRQQKSDAPEEAAIRVLSQIADQTIRDQDGKIIFRGTVDLSPTLLRIQAGERLARFSHDGTTFQNREGRLPRQPTGYYKEYVHPTPGQSGPGPQRIVMGEEGETYYTADHYGTFVRLDE